MLIIQYNSQLFTHNSNNKNPIHVCLINGGVRNSRHRETLRNYQLSLHEGSQPQARRKEVKRPKPECLLQLHVDHWFRLSLRRPDLQPRRIAFRRLGSIFDHSGHRNCLQQHHLYQHRSTQLDLEYEILTFNGFLKH